MSNFGFLRRTVGFGPQIPGLSYLLNALSSCHVGFPISIAAHPEGSPYQWNHEFWVGRSASTELAEVLWLSRPDAGESQNENCCNARPRCGNPEKDLVKEYRSGAEPGKSWQREKTM